MLISGSHGQALPLTQGQTKADCSSFGYYFEDAPTAPFNAGTLEAIQKLHKDMVETTPGPEGDHSSLPPIFTYFGQFVDHDITGLALDDDADPLLPIQSKDLKPEARAELRTKILNVRSGFFDLDSLYGAVRPSMTPAQLKLNSLLRFPGDRAMMWLGTFGKPDNRVTFPKDPAADLLRLDRLLETGRFTEEDIADLPGDQQKMFFLPDGSLNRSRAIIAEPRNDENLFIAQLHLAWLRFHNRVVQAWPHPRKAGDEDDVYEWARENVRLYYQWLVINVWLPGICDPKVVRDILATGPRLYDEFLTNCDWKPGDALPIPLEFSTACYRFGHSTVRGTYDWNHNFGRSDANPNSRARFEEMFTFTGLSPDPMFGQGPKLPANWGADWDRLVHPMSAFADRSTRLVDTSIAIPLTTMRNEGGDPVRQNLIARNLLRGIQHNLPTAQAVIARLNGLGIAVPQMTKAQISSGNTAGEIKDGNFDDHTPLWFYTLKEAELLGRGQRLGPLGSQIVAGTIIGLILRGPDPVWRKPGSHEGRWHPVDGPRISGQLVDSFPAFIRAALLMENPDV